MADGSGNGSGGGSHSHSRSGGMHSMAPSTSLSGGTRSDGRPFSSRVTGTTAGDKSSRSIGADGSGVMVELEARLRRSQAARQKREQELDNLHKVVLDEYAQLDAGVGGVDDDVTDESASVQSGWSYGSQDCPRAKQTRDPRLRSPLSSTARRGTSAAPTAKYYPDARDGHKPPFVGVDYDWARPGGYHWQARMKAEKAAMDVQVGIASGRLYPIKQFSDRPRSVRYLASASARRSRTGHACECFPPQRALEAPTTLRVTGPLDELRMELLNRPFKTYHDFLHDMEAAPPVPLP